MNLRHKRAQPNTLVVSFLRLGTLNDQEAVNRCVQIVSTKSAWLLSKSQHLMFVKGGSVPRLSWAFSLAPYSVCRVTAEGKSSWCLTAGEQV